jgi:thiamine kinase-like enzyme
MLRRLLLSRVKPTSSSHKIVNTFRRTPITKTLSTKFHTTATLRHSSLPSSSQLVTMLTKRTEATGQSHPKPPTHLTPFKSSKANWAESYYWFKENKGYTARITREMKKHELYAAVVAARAGLAPKVYDVDFEKGTIVTDFITNNTNWMNQINDQSLVALGNIIREFSTLPIPAPVSSQESDVILKHRETACKSKDPYILRIVRRFDELNNELASHNTMFMHGDFHPRNLLFDNKKFWMIDFEFSRKGSPLLDIATMALFLKLPPTQERILLDAVFEGNNDHRLTDYYKFKELSALRYAIIFAGKINTKLTAKMITATPAYNMSKEQFDVNKMHPSENAVAFYKASVQATMDSPPTTKFSLSWRCCVNH